MCLILFAYRQHPEFTLVVAANRDEFYERPSQPAHFWEHTPQLLAGRDLRAGGTWLGVTRHGRFAAVTNVREPNKAEAARSRGDLTTAFLLSELSTTQFDEQIEREAYAGFNLLHWDGTTLHYSSNRAPSKQLGPGIYGLSNASVDSPWPKVLSGRQCLAHALGHANMQDALWTLLADRQQPPDELLPDTGVGLDTERMLAPRFIRAPHYGTRSSTVLLLRENGSGEFFERGFDAENSLYSTHYRW